MNILFFIILCCFLYLIIKPTKKSFFLQPTIPGVVFYRDVLFLTLIPYLYYTHNGKYQNHYIFSLLDSDKYFYLSALFVTAFFFFFLSSYKIFYSFFAQKIRNINLNISVKKVLFYIRLFCVILVLYFIFASFYLQGGIISLATLAPLEMIQRRAELTQTSGWLSINKLIIKYWISSAFFLLLFIRITSKDMMTKFDHWLFVIMFIVSVGSSIFFLEKAPLFFFFFGIFGIYSFAGQEISKKSWLFVLFIGCAVVSIMYLVTYQDRIIDFQYLVDILVHRTFSQATGSVMALHYFDFHEHLHVTGISGILSEVAGSEFKSVYGTIIDYYVPETSLTSGAMSSFVSGDAYGLFGIYGVLVSGIVIAIYVSFLEACRGSKAFSFAFAGMYGIFFSQFLISSSFYGFIWPIGFILQNLPLVLIALLSLKYSN